LARRFTFIDLFAGIGGFRLALEQLGGECRFSCEWDKYSRQTYEAWFGEVPHGDIRELNLSDIPDHDLLAAGFPCQPFSLAGVSKKNSLGREHGFRDDTQGTLFFRLAEIIEAKRPTALLLENVKNLRSHDKGKTWRIVRRTLEELDYWVFTDVIDAAGWVPQHRERVYIAGFDRRRFPMMPQFYFPSAPARNPALKTILDPSPDPKYTLTPKLWQYLQNYAEKHKAQGHGFGFGIADPEGISRTLSARYYKDGSEILIAQGDDRQPRRLTPRECSRLMGFDGRPIVVSDTQAYRQFGNAVVPKVIEAIGREMIEFL
jgi:DNA (cytosine-5)-methyltransferase 1